MKITVYNVKGGVGKTPIATNIALEREYAIGTNERLHIFDSFIPDNRLLSLGLRDAFPDVPDDIDIVFDLAGAIDEEAHSITSAIRQSDLLIIPVNCEVKALHGAIHTFREARGLSDFHGDILVVATKLEKVSKENKATPWDETREFRVIQEAMKTGGYDGVMLPLKGSKAFDAVFERERSINQIRDEDALARHSFREVAAQFDEIFNYVDAIDHAQQKRLKRA